MPKVNFSTTYQEAEKNYNLGKGEYFKLQEGDNKLRLISECLPHESVYQGKKTFKFLCQVLDLKDGKVKPFFMPVTVFKHIESLQLDEDYTFDEVPMPYNLNVRAIGAGTKEVKYSVIPSPQRKPLTEEQNQKIAEAPTVQELQAKLKEKAPEILPEDTRKMKEEGEEGFVEVAGIDF